MLLQERKFLKKVMCSDRYLMQVLTMFYIRFEILCHVRIFVFVFFFFGPNVHIIPLWR